MIIWVDGRSLDESELRISPLDPGLLTGSGVFETLRAYAGTPFAWTRHAQRLASSATALGITPPDGLALRRAVAEVLEANGLADARLRITLTGGRDGARGITLVVATPLPPRARAAVVVFAPWPRNDRGALTGVKSTSHAENVRAAADARARGADEAVFANTRGDLCEGATSNVFLVERGRVVTPPLSAGCLAGVTRALVLELCATTGIGAVQENRPAGALAEADEAFLTSSTREVQPMVRIGEETRREVPGPVTQRLARAYGELVRANPDP